MSEKEFLNWLRGFFELANPTRLNADQVALIKAKLEQSKPESASPVA